MSIIKSFSVGNGDMFYIRHDSDNFTIIDCCITEENREPIVSELISQSSQKTVTRFISTHPDDDHVCGLKYLIEKMGITNFYCVKNEATKIDQSDDFDEYCTLRDNKNKSFYIYRNCKRKWMNETCEERGSSGISIIWPKTDNKHYLEALSKAKKGECPNNISPIIKYSLSDGATMLWMGDMETRFMENIKDIINLPACDILFAPHHGRDSGKVPQSWLNDINPKIIIVGEAPSKYLHYYPDYNTITQNTAGSITFDCVPGNIHIYVSNENYTVDFLEDKDMPNSHDYYLGTLSV